MYIFPSETGEYPEECHRKTMDYVPARFVVVINVFMFVPDKTVLYIRISYKNEPAPYPPLTLSEEYVPMLTALDN